MTRGLLLVLSLLICAVCSKSLFARNVVQPRIKEDVCSATTCVGAGANCTGNFVNCVDNTYCSLESHTCVKQLDVGAVCTGGMECLSDQCEGGKCVPANYGMTPPGGKCTNSTECSPVTSHLAGPFGECVNGRCHGLLIGEKCNNTNQFSTSGCINSFCSSKTLTCSAFYVSGQICDAEDECSPYLACTNGICKYLNYSVEGGNCSHTYNCDKDLYCGTDGICHAKSKINYKACNATMPCSDGLTCECNGHAGGVLQCWAPVSTGAIATGNAFQRCWEANNCTTKNYTSDCIDSGVCRAEVCAELTALDALAQEQYPVTAQCLIDFYDSKPSNTGSNVDFATYCPTPNGDDGFPTWAIVLIVIAGIVVLAVLGYFVYVKTSKKDQYSSI